jgi:hypothetical protein
MKARQLTYFHLLLKELILLDFEPDSGYIILTQATTNCADV